MAETTETRRGADKDAPPAQAGNEKLKHSQGGATTRDDRLDAGVKMLQGDPSEPQGPEDALGSGPKRGDYRDRQDGTVHYESVPTEDGGEPILKDGVVVDFKPTMKLVAQNPRVEEIGEAKGRKGGVDSADD